MVVKRVPMDPALVHIPVYSRNTRDETRGGIPTPTPSGHNTTPSHPGSSPSGHNTAPSHPGKVPVRPEFEARPGSILLIDKPLDWTSFDVIRHLRGRLGIRKMGHAGTLDPKATGMLVCCCGPATRLVDRIQMMEKRYEAEILLGQTSPSFDVGTPVSETAPWRHITHESITQALPSFIGQIQQVPPMYSALKSSGRRLYELARRGETIEREPRTVCVHEIQIMEVEQDRLRVSILCGKGTYIRAIARDLGRALGTCAMLTALRRTAIGPYSAQDALTPQQAAERWAGHMPAPESTPDAASNAGETAS